MKTRIVLTMMLLALASVAYGKSPNLECEKAFDRALAKDPSVTLTVYNQPGNYYRCTEVSGDRKLVKQIKDWVLADRKRAFNSTEKINDENVWSVILNISNGEYLINVGLRVFSEDSCNLFVQGVPEAFE